MVVEEETSTIEVLRKLRQKKKKAKKEEAEQSLVNTLPAVFVNALTLNSKEHPQTPTTESNKNKTEDYVCKRCQNKTSDKEDLPISTGMLKPTNMESSYESVGMSDTTMLVAHQLKSLKEQRRRFEEQQKLNEVLDRVQAALDYSGIKFDEEYVPSFQTEMFSIDGNKQKKKERSYIYDMFEESAQLGRNRDNVMQDVENWFAVSCDDLETFCEVQRADSSEALLSDDYFVRIHKAFRRSSESVNKLIQALHRSQQLHSLQAGERISSSLIS